jgi:hypothetical protein
MRGLSVDLPGAQMSSSQPPPSLPRPGPPVPGHSGNCAELRRLLLTLQDELRQDNAFLSQLRNSHGSPEEIAQWQETVSLKSGEVQSTRDDMEAAGCFETPPHPPPPVVFTEMGPATIVDEDGKVVGNGAVVDLAVLPGSGGVLFAASAGGGVWRASGAASAAPAWETRTDALPSTAMGAVAIAAGDPSGRTVLAGTGSFSSWGPTGPAVGLYKSTDGGDTWRLTAAALQGRLVRTILPLAPPHGAVVLVAARTGTASGGIFRSTDGGETFGPARAATLRGQLPAGDGYALIEDPAAPGRVYCAVGGSRAGIFRSDDAGRDWKRVCVGISATDLAGPAWIRLAVGRPVPKFGGSILYAGIVGSSGQLSGLYTAITGRDSWAPITLPPGGGAAMHPNKMGSTKFAIAAHPHAPWLYVAGETGGLWRADVSDPAAAQWTPLTAASTPATANVPADAPHSDCQVLVFDAGRNLLMATDGGIYRVTGPDQAAPTWQHIGETMHVNEPLSVSYDTLTSVAMNGSADNGVEYQPSPGMLRWQKLDWGDGGGSDIDNSAADYSLRYYITFSGGITTSTFSVHRVKFDNANTQIEAGELMLAAPATPGMALTGIAPVDQTQNALFAVNAVAADRLLLAGNNVYETTDGGATVTTLLTRPAGLAGSARLACGGRQDDADQPGVAYCAIGNRIWRRKPGEPGLSEPGGYAGGPVLDIGVDVHDWRLAVMIEGSRVWRTPDAGDTWTECTGNLPGLAADPLGAVNLHNVVIIRAAPTSLREVILVGAYTGLYRTVTAAAGSAAVWEPVGNLPNAVVQSMRYRPSRAGHVGGDVLVVGLQGRGTWLLTDASLHV